MFNMVGNNVFSSSNRHRKQASWTSFESPFFGSGGGKVHHHHHHHKMMTTTMTDAEGETKDSDEGSPSVRLKEEVKTPNSSPSTPAPKQSGKSVATATTASMEGGTPSASASGGGGRFLHSPALTDDLNLVDPSRVSQGKITRAPPVLNMDDLPKIGMSTLGTHRGSFAPRQSPVDITGIRATPITRRHYRDLPEFQQDETTGVDASRSEDTDSSDSPSEREGIRLSRRKATAAHDPCMPMVLDDVRELVSTSVSKTLFFFNQVSNFFHVDGSSRRNHPKGGIDRPTTVFIVPRSGNAPLNPPLLTEDSADDLSSLTEPPGLRPETTGHVLAKPGTNHRRKNGTIQANRDKHGEESIEFESDSIIEFESNSFDIDIDLEPVELFDDVLLGMKPGKTLLPPSIFPVLDPPVKQSIPSTPSVPFNPPTEESRFEGLPVLADKISEVSTDVPSSTDPRIRFPFANFRPRSRKDHRYLAAVRDEYRSLSPPVTPSPPPPPPPPPPPSGAPRRQGTPKMSPTSVKVVWGSEVPKPGMIRSLRHLQRHRPRLEKCDLASVEC